MCLCNTQMQKDRERKRERQKERQTDRQTERESGGRDGGEEEEMGEWKDQTQQEVRQCKKE